MHLRPTFLTLFATLLLTTHTTLAADGAIRFCNEAKFLGECTEQLYFDAGNCYAIPDSNAKADKGSSFRVTQGGAYCALWTGKDCTGTETTGFLPWIENITDNRIYRNVMCLCMDEVDGKCPKLKDYSEGPTWHA